MNLSEGRSAVVITDASCLIILEKIALSNILQQLFAFVITTPEIADEYGKHLPEWIVVVSVKDKSLQQRFSDLVDPGEASAIALAQEIDNDFVITDDLEARKLCAKLGLPFMGTLGVLILAKQNGFLREVKPILEQIKRTNFRLTEDLYRAVIKKAGEV